MVSLTWNIKLNATNEQTGKKFHRHRQQFGGHQHELEGVVMGKAGQIYDGRRLFDLGGGHTVQFTDHVS